MKKITYYILLIFLFSNCSKSDTSTPQQKYGTVIFYTLNPAQHNKWRIIVDNVDRGLEPYTIIVPTCDNNPGILGLFIKLPVGKHNVKKESVAGYAGWEEEITVVEGCQSYD